MNPALVAAVRQVIDDWRREADGSRSMAEYHERAAVESREQGERNARTHVATALEHAADADRATAAGDHLEAALAAAGVDPEVVDAEVAP